MIGCKLNIHLISSHPFYTRTVRSEEPSNNDPGFRDGIARRVSLAEKLQLTAFKNQYRGLFGRLCKHLKGFTGG